MARLRIAGLALVAVVLVACATRSVTTSKSIPSWVSTTPPASAGYTYFVGSGSDTDGNIAAANENAVHSLISDVTRYLGVAISSQTTVETRADVKSFETHIAETIKESSDARVGDFTIVDRWIRRDAGQVTVFLLGKYRTTALEAEKSRLESLERERTDAVAVPEARGDALLAQGRAYQAAVQFTGAALGATQPGITGSALKFERNIKKAVEAVAGLKLSVLTGSLSAILGKPFAAPFAVKVSAHDGATERALANVPFVISYPILRSNGRTGIGTIHLVSGGAGVVTVRLPPPQLIGRHTVTVALDMGPLLAPLLSAPAVDRALVSSLERQVNSVRVEVSYSATSRASSIPTGVLVTDLDRGGSPITGDITAAGIVNALTQAGFDIIPIPSTLHSPGASDADIVKSVRSSYGTRIKRVIVGQARIAGFEQSNGNYIVKVSGRVEVADLETGKVLLATSRIKLSRASDATSAISAAFKYLGISIGDEIRNRLF